MHVADLCSDMNVLQTAQAAAQELLAADPELNSPEHQALRLAVDRMFEMNAASSRVMLRPADLAAFNNSC